MSPQPSDYLDTAANKNLEAFPAYHARRVKHQLFMDEDLSELSIYARYAYIGILTICDRHGNFLWKPKRLKHEVLPYDNIDFESLLDELVKGRFVERYEFDGHTYGHIRSWRKHQDINKTEWNAKFVYPLDPQSAADSEIVEHERKINPHVFARANTCAQMSTPSPTGTQQVQNHGFGSVYGSGSASGSGSESSVVDVAGPTGSKTSTAQPAGKSDDDIFHEYREIYDRMVPHSESLISRSTEPHRKEAADLYRLLGKEETLTAWGEFLKDIPTRPTSTWWPDNPNGDAGRGRWCDDTEERTWVLHDFVLQCGQRTAVK